MSTPTPNVPLLRKVTEWVEAEGAKSEHDPSRSWFQGVWRGFKVACQGNLLDVVAGGERISADHYRCGTAYCFAGYTMELAEGWQWAKYDDEGNLTDDEVVHVDRPNDVIPVATAARRELGLTTREAADLFTGYNSVATIRAQVDAVLRRAGDRL